MRRPKLQAVLSAAIEAAARRAVAGFLTPIAAGALVGVMIVACLHRAPEKRVLRVP